MGDESVGMVNMLSGSINNAVLIDHVFLADRSMDGLWLSNFKAVRTLSMEVLLFNSFH
jgi:hypothetical protein